MNMTRTATKTKNNWNQSKYDNLDLQEQNTLLLNQNSSYYITPVKNNRNIIRELTQSVEIPRVTRRLDLSKQELHGSPSLTGIETATVDLADLENSEQARGTFVCDAD